MAFGMPGLIVGSIAVGVKHREQLPYVVGSFLPGDIARQVVDVGPHLEYDPIGPPQLHALGETPSEVEPIEGAGPAGAGVCGAGPAGNAEPEDTQEGAWYEEQLDSWKSQNPTSLQPY